MLNNCRMDECPFCKGHLDLITGDVAKHKYFYSRLPEPTEMAGLGNWEYSTTVYLDNGMSVKKCKHCNYIFWVTQYYKSNELPKKFLDLSVPSSCECINDNEKMYEVYLSETGRYNLKQTVKMKDRINNHILLKGVICPKCATVYIDLNQLYVIPKYMLGVIILYGGSLFFLFCFFSIVIGKIIKDFRSLFYG